MRIRTGFEIAFDCPQPTPMMLMLSIHPERDNDLVTPDTIRTDPDVPVHTYLDGFGNRCTRLVAPAGRLTVTTDALVVDSGELDVVIPDAQQAEVQDLPDDTLVYLLGSRYCDTDRMSDIAWNLFGNAPLGWGRVKAICDFAHGRIAFNYQNAHSERTAFDGYTQRTGVCRDFAHLAITLCRCMNIPARYCTGYLGDIGVPKDTAPMDFSAWFEAYLDGRWYTFDARHNRPRIGRILMARGRDAADVALSNTFGPNQLAVFKVWTDEVAA